MTSSTDPPESAHRRPASPAPPERANRLRKQSIRRCGLFLRAANLWRQSTHRRLAANDEHLEVDSCVLVFGVSVRLSFAVFARPEGAVLIADNVCRRYFLNNRRRS